MTHPRKYAKYKILGILMGHNENAVKANCPVAPDTEKNIQNCSRKILLKL